MTFDELIELADEMGIKGDQQLVVFEPDVGFATIEGLEQPKYGPPRMIIQGIYDTELEGATHG